MEKTPSSCPFFGSAAEVNESIRGLTNKTKPGFWKHYFQNTSQFLWYRDSAVLEYIRNIMEKCPSGVQPSPVAHKFKGVVITNPEIANKLLKYEKGAEDKKGGKLDGGPDFGHLFPFMGEKNLLTTNNKDEHSKWKPFFRETFGPRKIYEKIPMIRSMTQGYFKHTLGKGVVVEDLKNWVHNLVSRVVTNIASLNEGIEGYTWNEDGSPNPDFTKVSKAAQKVAKLVSEQVVGNPSALIDKAEDEKNILEFAAGVIYGNSLCEAKRKIKKGVYDLKNDGLFERMIETNLVCPESKLKFSETIIHDFTLLVLIVGPGTTSSGILSVLINLMEHMKEDFHLQKMIREEISKLEVEPEVALSNLSKYLPFTYAVMQESFRLSPPVPGQTRQILNTIKISSDSLGGDIIFPEGMYILYASYFTNRHPGIWGSDVEKFNPMRFLKEDGSFNSGVKKNLMTFGAGNKHVCAGRAFAETMIATFLYEFVTNYEIAKTSEESLDDLYQQGGIFLRVNKEVPGRIKPKPPSPKDGLTL